MGKERFNRPLYLLIVVSTIISIVGGSMLLWFDKSFGVSLSEILYTLSYPLEGASYDFLWIAVVIFITSCAVAVVLILLVKTILYPGSTKVKEHSIFRIITNKFIDRRWITAFLLATCIGSAAVIIKADQILQISQLVKSSFLRTTIYDDYYVIPAIENIESENERNLIYIFLESMETTYASDKAGGKQAKRNFIPRLANLAQKNISFSNTDKLGGFHCTTGSGWTMGAIFSAEAGIPFAFPIDGNHMDRVSRFAAGTITLGDILREKGYNQEFLCGSEAEFAGRKVFFEQHGDYAIYDLNTAIDNGTMTENEKVWWGFEDRMLYEIAREEITRLAHNPEPFNLTMLTVDTHHIDGWVCELCESKYPEQLANVISCADNQIYNFIEWCKEQEWYENTTIVIQGDHPRMDQSLVAEVDYYDRTIYNCFINTEYDKNSINCTNREFTAFDMFPTVLASIGFTIPDDKLGLGVNLFSNKKTLAEELGYDYIENEITKSSNYYKRFY